MAESDSKASSLVEKGLQLYSQGKLDEALAQWREALAVVPDHPRAKDYIRYVEENRSALEESFRLSGSADGGSESMSTDEPWQPAESSSPEQAESDPLALDLPDEDEDQDFSFQLSDGTEKPIPQEPLPHEKVTPGGMMQQISGKLDEEIETTARMNMDVLQAKIDATREGSTQTPATLSPSVTSPGGRQRIDTPFQVMPGGGEPAGEDGFEPNERTPVGVDLPKPARLVKETPPESFVLDELTPALDPSAMGPLDFIQQTTPAPISDLEGDERVDSMLAGALQLHEQGTYESSLWLCDRILSIEPDNQQANQLLESNRKVLREQYYKQIGDLTAVPVVQIPQNEIMWHKLDHRAGFLLSRIDGQLTFEDIIDISGMDAFESSRILAQLLSMNVIGPRK